MNGPEVLDKYVGGSEEKIRALFADAEKEQVHVHAEGYIHLYVEMYNIKPSSRCVIDENELSTLYRCTPREIEKETLKFVPSRRYVLLYTCIIV